MRAIVIVLGSIMPLLLGADCDCDEDGGTGVDAAGIDAPSVPVNPGFATPTAVTKANMRAGGVWTELGDADWTCLGTPTADQPSTQAIAVSGLVTDFQIGDPVGNATITAFPGAMVNGNSGQATSSNVAATRGQFAMTLARLPAGERRFGTKLEATGYLKTYQLARYLDPADATATIDAVAWSESTANAMPAFIGVVLDSAEGTVVGTMRDCAGREVSNAIATVSSVAGTVSHVATASTHYFSAGNTVSLPVRVSLAPSMNKDGLFIVLGLQPQSAPAFIQVWGFTTAARLAAGQLTLLAELPAPIEANAFMTAELEPLRTP